MPKIYTKTGDAGASSLYNGERRFKNDIIFKALGDIDELNASLGVLTLNDPYNEQILWVQSRLLDLGSNIATPRDNSSENKLLRTRFPAEHAKTLEEWIDDMETKLPKLVNFILPTGPVHMSRAICRRAERSIIDVSKETEVIQFINRLSDYLFVLARTTTSREEIIYKKS